VNSAQYALAGVVLGAAIPALATLWQAVQHGKQAEREREAARAERRANHRLSLIASWREGLAAAVAETGMAALSGGTNPLHTQPWYLSLRPHLSEQARRRVEPGDRVVMVPGDAPILFSLADEIARIEREWGLT
jgi:hypothetical protein